MRSHRAATPCVAGWWKSPAIVDAVVGGARNLWNLLRFSRKTFRAVQRYNCCMDAGSFAARMVMTVALVTVFRWIYAKIGVLLQKSVGRPGSQEGSGLAKAGSDWRSEGGPIIEHCPDEGTPSARISKT